MIHSSREQALDEDEMAQANTAQAPLAPTLFTRNPAGGTGPLPVSADAPPWVQEISSGILSLHNKVDLSRNELAQYGAEIQAEGIRVSHLESVAHEHTQQLLEAQRQIQIHEARIKELGKVPELEKRLNELEAANRCLTPPQPSTMRGPPSPRSPRSTRSSAGDSREEEGDLNIIIGGWTDASTTGSCQHV